LEGVIYQSILKLDEKIRVNLFCNMELDSKKNFSEMKLSTESSNLVAFFLIVNIGEHADILSAELRVPQCCFTGNHGEIVAV
tara:strand:- start:234 stop:479 length:246 start_codon:yes stop_codon:yes gene_type:complete